MAKFDTTSPKKREAIRYKSARAKPVSCILLHTLRKPCFEHSCIFPFPHTFCSKTRVRVWVPGYLVPAMARPSAGDTVARPEIDLDALKHLLKNPNETCIMPCQLPDGSFTSSFDSTPANSSDDEEETGDPKKDQPRRLSRGQRLKRSFSKRATSFTSELPFSRKGKSASSASSKRSSGQDSQIQFTPTFSFSESLNSSPQQISSPEETSPTHSLTQTLAVSDYSTPVTCVPLPEEPERMASRQSLLHPATAHRLQAQVSEAKARTHKIAEDEEKFIRERMRKAGTEHLFPKYRFVDFIGKGNYGRVYHA